MTREIAEWAGQIAQLKRLIDEQAEGASDEWVGAAHRALRDAEQRLRELRGPDDGVTTRGTDVPSGQHHG